MSTPRRRRPRTPRRRRATLARLKPSAPRVPRERAAKRAGRRLATLAIARKKTRHRRGRHRRRQRVAPDVLRLGRKRVARDEPSTVARRRRSRRVRVGGSSSAATKSSVARSSGCHPAPRVAAAAVETNARSRRRRKRERRRVLGRDESTKMRRGDVSSQRRERRRRSRSRRTRTRSRRRSSRPPLARLAYPYLPVPLILAFFGRYRRLTILRGVTPNRVLRDPTSMSAGTDARRRGSNRAPIRTRSSAGRRRVAHVRGGEIHESAIAANAGRPSSADHPGGTRRTRFRCRIRLRFRICRVVAGVHRDASRDEPEHELPVARTRPRWRIPAGFIPDPLRRGDSPLYSVATPETLAPPTSTLGRVVRSRRVGIVVDSRHTSATRASSNARSTYASSGGDDVKQTKTNTRTRGSSTRLFSLVVVVPGVGRDGANARDDANRRGERLLAKPRISRVVRSRASSPGTETLQAPRRRIRRHRRADHADAKHAERLAERLAERFAERFAERLAELSSPSSPSSSRSFSISFSSSRWSPRSSTDHRGSRVAPTARMATRSPLRVRLVRVRLAAFARRIAHGGIRHRRRRRRLGDAFRARRRRLGTLCGRQQRGVGADRRWHRFAEQSPSIASDASPRGV